jgi:uncharacterized membrane protein YkoI
MSACSEKEHEKKIAISELPAIVVSAVNDTLPGFVISEAEIEGTGQEIIYEVEGNLNGQKFEIEITSEGKILEIEEENDEDTDDDDENEEATNKEDDRNTDH